jgi:hypothetical protein
LAEVRVSAEPADWLLLSGRLAGLLTPWLFADLSVNLEERLFTAGVAFSRLLSVLVSPLFTSWPADDLAAVLAERLLTTGFSARLFEL